LVIIILKLTAGRQPGPGRLNEIPVDKSVKKNYKYKPGKNYNKKGTYL